MKCHSFCDNIDTGKIYNFFPLTAPSLLGKRNNIPYLDTTVLSLECLKCCLNISTFQLSISMSLYLNVTALGKIFRKIPYLKATDNQQTINLKLAKLLGNITETNLMSKLPAHTHGLNFCSKEFANNSAHSNTKHPQFKSLLQKICTHLCKLKRYKKIIGNNKKIPWISQYLCSGTLNVLK